MIQTFKCPSCGAPLDYEDNSEQVSVRCPFCYNSVVVPETLRRHRGFQGHSSYNPAVGRSSKVNPAVAFLSVVFIFAIVGGVIYGVTRLLTRSSSGVPANAPPRIGFIPPLPSSTPQPMKSGFVELALKFGGEGIGPGLFKDARSIAVDAEGRIYTGDYTGGRIQVFDGTGKFLTQWMVDAKMPLRALAVDRKGTVYVVQSGDIMRYDGMTGAPRGKIPFEGGWGFDDVVTTADGGLVAAWYKGRDDLVRFDSAGRVSKVIRGAFSGQTDRSELNTRIAVDGLGNIYALGTFNRAVLKFTPEGRFVTQFGSSGDEPGQFHAPHSIAVDGQGRVYVGDFKGVQVFDGNGRLIDTFKPDGLTLGMTFNDKNELFVAARTQLLKYRLKKP